jgi:hypothetical protein
VTSWDSSASKYSLHTLATMQDERQKLEGQAIARSVWNIIVSGVTEQLSQVEQLNEKLWKVGRSDPGNVVTCINCMMIISFRLERLYLFVVFSYIIWKVLISC